VRARLELGAELDLLSPGELDKSLDRVAGNIKRHMDSSAGVKYRRIPQLSGTAATGVLNIGGDAGAGVTWNGQPVGPGQGYAWILGLVTVAGLTAGAVPDIVNLFINGAGSNIPWWQFNGNNFAYTFGDGELVLYPGETLSLQSVGAFAATGRITLTGSVRSQVPAEKLGRAADR
jgi:hypothetical protein